MTFLSGGPRGGAAGNKRQAVKRKAGASGNASGGNKKSNTDKDNDSDREFDISNMEIDPDEPTYCLCDQVLIKIDIITLHFPDFFIFN